MENMKKILAAFPAAALIVAAAACGGGGGHVPVTAPTSWSAQAATVKGCRDLAAWENGNSSVPFYRDRESQVILNESAGTQFASDLRSWMDATQSGDLQSAMTDAGTVGADCAAVGVPSTIGNG